MVTAALMGSAPSGLNAQKSMFKRQRSVDAARVRFSSSGALPLARKGFSLGEMPNGYLALRPLT